MNEADRAKQSEQFEEELALARRRLEVAPRDTSLERRVGYLLCALRRYEEAASWYEEVVSTHPEDADAWYALGFAAAGSGAFVRAEKALQTALLSGRDDGEVHAELAFTLLNLNQHEQAIRQGERALEFTLDPNSKARLHTVLGTCYATLGEVGTKLYHYRAAVAVDQTDATTLLNLGSALIDQGDFAEAVQLLKEATELAPRRWEAWYALAMAARGLGDLVTEQQSLERSLSLGVETAELRGELAYVLQQLDQPKAAIREAKRAANLTQDEQQRAWLHDLIACCRREAGDERSGQPH